MTGPGHPLLVAWTHPMPVKPVPEATPAYERLIPKGDFAAYRIFRLELQKFLGGKLRKTTPNREARAARLAEGHIQALGTTLHASPAFWAALLGSGSKGLTPIQAMRRAARVASRDLLAADDLDAALGFIPVDEFLGINIVPFTKQ